jgi:hypothetical protein
MKPPTLRAENRDQSRARLVIDGGIRQQVPWAPAHRIERQTSRLDYAAMTAVSLAGPQTSKSYSE